MAEHGLPKVRPWETQHVKKDKESMVKSAATRAYKAPLAVTPVGADTISQPPQLHQGATRDPGTGTKFTDGLQKAQAPKKSLTTPPGSTSTLPALPGSMKTHVGASKPISGNSSLKPMSTFSSAGKRF